MASCGHARQVSIASRLVSYETDVQAARRINASAEATEERLRHARLVSFVSQRGWRAGSLSKISSVTLRAAIMIHCSLTPVKELLNLSDDDLVKHCNVSHAEDRSDDRAVLKELCSFGPDEQHNRRYYQVRIASNEAVGRSWTSGLPHTPGSTWWWFGMEKHQALARLDADCITDTTTVHTHEEVPRSKSGSSSEQSTLHIADRTRRNALCLVGGLRSFAVPAIHRNIQRVAEDWPSDIFANVHTYGDEG